jgi:uncharacterized protein
MKLFRTYNDLGAYLKPNKVLVIFGPRQVGKTTLLKTYLESFDGRYKLESGDNILIREILGSEILIPYFPMQKDTISLLLMKRKR